jgi:hypothetical protein
MQLNRRVEIKPIDAIGPVETVEWNKLKLKW